MRTTRLFAFIALIAVVTLLVAVPAEAARSVRNDSPAHAMKVSHLPYQNLQNVTDATYVDEPIGTCGSLGGQTVWYKYTAKVVGTLQADTVGSYRADSSDNYDTVLQVFTYDGTNWSPIVCNDDSTSADPNNTNASKVQFGTTAGTTYYFQLGAFSSTVYTAPMLAFNLSWVSA